MKKETKSKISGWIAVSISSIFATLWSYWGIIENFHEGWYHINIWDNIFMMFGQYLMVPIAFIIIGSISVTWNKIGALLHLAIAFYMYFMFGKINAGLFFISIPIVILAFLYWFGSFNNRIIGYIFIAIIPLLIILIIGSIQLYKVSNRFNDNNFGARKIMGNGVELFWAPAGPGWPDHGTNWEEAKRICSHLSEDGSKVTSDSLNIWRLPTIKEAVASQVNHGVNVGGKWNEKTNEATYRKQPDKESPLWNPNVKTIYWWTSTEVNGNQAYIIVYNGGVYPRHKTVKAGYLNFRAVRDILHKNE